MTYHLDLARLIDALPTKPEEPRNYIAASSIGNECWRSIWYAYKNNTTIQLEPRTKRTFDIGKTLEQLIISWIEDAGIPVHGHMDLFDKDIPYFRGHVDGIIYADDLPCILEIKTMKESSFNSVVKSGVKAWSPTYYSQVQSYMGMSEIYETYFLSLNKNNAMLYSEHIFFDPRHYDELKTKAQMIASFESPPNRINLSPSYFKCKMCNFRSICHG